MNEWNVNKRDIDAWQDWRLTSHPGKSPVPSPILGTLRYTVRRQPHRRRWSKRNVNFSI